MTSPSPCFVVRPPERLGVELAIPTQALYVAPTEGRRAVAKELATQD